MTLLAFHNDPKIKQTYLDRVRAHNRADEIVHGIYWENGKGCAIGCTIHSSKHDRYETELGIPEVLAHLEDSIFEALPRNRAKLWPEQFLAEVSVGADLSLIWPKFVHWMLLDEKDGVLKFADSVRVRIAIISIGKRFERRASGEKVPYSSSAAKAAGAAVSSEEARAARAAEAAEEAAEKQANKLLQLLSEAPLRAEVTQ